MNPHALPPLLRGIGLTVILLGTSIGLIQARQDAALQAAQLRAHAAATCSAAPELCTLSAEIRELREQVIYDGVAEDLLDNHWFEWLGIVGSAIMAATFFGEWYVRRNEGQGPAG